VHHSPPPDGHPSALPRAVVGQPTVTLSPVPWWRPYRHSLGLCFLLLAAVTIKYGVSLHPNWFRFVDAAARWPDASQSLLAVGDRALLSNVAPSWLAGAVRATTNEAYVALSAVLTAGALTLPLLVSARTRGRSFAQLYFLVIAGGALAPVLLMWVGGYDAILACGLVIGAMCRSRWIGALGWLVAAITHSAVAIPAFLAWAAFILINESVRGDRRSVFAASMRLRLPLGALILGCVAIRLVTDIWGGSTDRLALFRAIPFSAIVESYAASWPWVLISGLGITWVLLLWPPVRRVRGTRVFTALAAGIVLLTPLIAVDQTRVTALILLPLTLAWIDSVASQVPDDEFRPVWRWMLVPALLVPIPVVWMGVSYWPHGL